MTAKQLTTRYSPEVKINFTVRAKSHWPKDKDTDESYQSGYYAHVMEVLSSQMALFTHQNPWTNRRKGEKGGCGSFGIWTTRNDNKLHSRKGYLLLHAGYMDALIRSKLPAFEAWVHTTASKLSSCGDFDCGIQINISYSVTKYV